MVDDCTESKGRFANRRLAIWLAGFVWVAACCAYGPWATAEDENDYYRLVSVVTSKASTASRSKFWKPSPDGLPLEVSGLAVMSDGRVAVAIRKGEVWLLGNVYDADPANVTYHRFATGLHEPLGLLRADDGFYVCQRTELTRLRDTNGDDVADVYETAASGWGVTGNYHEYAFGPKRDADGNLWLTLNLGLGLKPEHMRKTIREPTLGVAQGKWRGWGLKVDRTGQLVPVCGGMRSPSGLGANLEGDMFYTDQQGNWVGSNSLHHMRPGAFFHHPDALASKNLPGSTLREVGAIPAGLPFPEAAKQLEALKPPAVWFPYKKVGQSATDVVCDTSGGRFGPFAGQLFIGEFTLASVNRVFLEKVEGEYQGACFPFREGFASAVIRMAMGRDGAMFAGLSNRGWSSLGPAAYGLQRIEWTGKTPFEIQEMRARPDGFELLFTAPVDKATAEPLGAWAMESFTYRYHAQYGSDEILRRQLLVRRAKVSEDARRVRLYVDRLRPMFVHALRADSLRDATGRPLLHPNAYYTLNRIPKQ